MLPALVHAHAKAHPNRTAVAVGQNSLTYAQLDDRVARLIRRLCHRGIGRGHLVGVHLDRTPDAVAAVLAVLGAGAAYTVIDPAEPATRNAGGLAAGLDLVLTSAAYRADLHRRGLDVLDVQEVLDGPRAPGGQDARERHADEDGPAGPAARPAPGEDDTAYVLYTSGSTGVPKGVMVTHRNIRHYTESLLDRLRITEPLRYAHVTTLAADLGNTCVFLALWTGGTLHLVDESTRRDPAGLLRYLRTERIDVVKTTPSHWTVLFQAFGLDAASRPALRYLLLGGELLPVPLARRILASGVTRTLVNHYGPTEATVGVATHLLTGEAGLDALGDAASVPIGSPLGATGLYVRTPDGTFHRSGATGELYITGPSVALGYRDNPQATAAAFTTELDTASPGAGRAYRTGDRVRADDRGVLEFLGRGDRQVKVGGYRVELGHVEAGLRRLPAVTDALALLLPGERKRLVAAVAAPAAGAGDLRARLRELLPSYMIPQRIEVFDAFPRTGNGKTDQAALRRLVESRLADRSEQARATDDPLLAEVCEAWRRQLGHDDFGIHDDFTLAGGNSIDAIQVIADLQAQGHRVSAAAFLAEPTAAALAARLRAGRSDRPAGHPAATPAETDDTALSPAQAWFFRQEFAQPDQWNQALLLDTDPSVQPAGLAAAVADVVALHPLLRTAFRPEGTAWRRVAAQPPAAFTSSVLPEDETAAAHHVRETAAACQRRIRVADGSLFQAHLFHGATRAHLLLVGHHLCVDAVSWRILVNDLSRCYSERIRGGTPATAAAATDFGAWATHLRAQAPALRTDLAHWDGLDRLPETAARSAAGDNREGDAEAVWFRLSRAETGALAHSAAASTGMPPHAALLGAFAQALALLRDTDEVVVDVESHGRVSLDDSLEVSRVVGWFTSTFPVRIDTVADDAAATGKAAAAALADIPRYGVAYGLHDRPQRTDVCFNYLGTLALPHGDDLRLTPSRRQLGPVRGPENDRGHGLKLTARIHDGQLVADLSYSPRRHSPAQVLTLARTTRAHLLAAAGLPCAEAQFVVEHGSSTGLLAQVPRALHCEPPADSVREYDSVLLTGATGFIGAHLLHLLLTRTTGHVHCLVRGRDGRSAAERLRDAYAWHLPGEDLDRYAGRFTVTAGDLAEPHLGLTREEHERLRREIGAIYHLAADTRLFGDRETFDRLNVEPLRALVELASTGRPKDLHYASTLAVCGEGPDGEEVVFSEESLNVGQRFLNEYERSKFDAERLVHAFTAAGGGGFIYRSGNVSGHSESGRFQRNGGDNRLVQLLRAAVRIGRVPQVGHRTLALSPVDVVAGGILEISRSERVRNGTFHVDTPHEVRYEDVFAVLRELGCPLAEDEAPDFASLFGRHLAERDEQVTLAHFWASRPERNVRYDHTRTRRLLAHLDVEFPTPERAWLRQYFTGLIEQGEISLADRKQG
ncbi:amino acid adenylation domain-containing protein [Kitasatospora sp. RG8]|uniref:non-ribosomal peptide synthetase n=1 Tax=Kitasatospora sp. RG8 TaxID=2820815 RepID=UPI001AE0B3ED|nr:non-ribosomal peptide synthetase [Kitasatospora sp. RG8]MBP0452920.1 amino acid adenylation domain-containing protein [Kitasatospora sp. RG8]